MRIVAGNFKGKVLVSPKTDNIRPTADKVKQAIFTKFQFDIVNSVVLDLFCGSGALGIEAISRNAKEVIFVDKSFDSVRLTKENLKLIKSNAKVINSDYSKVLKTIKKKFDFIFVDPPYASGVYENCLKLILENDLLSENGIVVCEHLAQNELNCELLDKFDEKKYGTVMVSFFKKISK